jgi:ABC-2 type transport system permease protein
MTMPTLLRHSALLARFELVDYTRSVGALVYAVLTPTLVLLAVAELWATGDSRGELVPEVVGMSILATGIFSIGVAVTEERRDGTLKTFMASPISFASYLAGHVISRVLALLVGAGLMIIVAAMRYDAGPAATWPLFVVTVVVSTATMLALGFLLASRSQKTESAGAIGSLLFIAGLVTVTVDADGAPLIVRWLLAAMPFEPMTTALRRTWSGDEIGAAAGDLGILVAWFGVFAGAASRLFRWSLARS